MCPPILWKHLSFSPVETQRKPMHSYPVETLVFQSLGNQWENILPILWKPLPFRPVETHGTPLGHPCLPIKWEPLSFSPMKAYRKPVPSYPELTLVFQPRGNP